MLRRISPLTAIALVMFTLVKWLGQTKSQSVNAAPTKHPIQLVNLAVISSIRDKTSQRGNAA